MNRSSSGFDRILLRRLNSSKLPSENTSHEDIIDYLRSTYPDYNRQKIQPFSRNVKRSLQINKHKLNITLSQSPSKPPRRKKPKLSPSSYSASDDSVSEEGSVSLSTSIEGDNDAVYSEEVEPVFDVTKEMLRTNLKQHAEVVAKKIEQDKDNEKEKNVEVEIMSKREVGGTKREGSVGGAGGGVEERNGPWFKDLGGMEDVLEELKIEVLVPFYFPEVPRKLGVKPMRGLLLHGLPGCGKTMLARAIANETGVPFYKISATEVVSGTSGESEERIRKLFANAHKNAPSIIFIDEIDAIAPKRENLQREMEKRIVTQLLTCMDESHQSAGSTYDVESNSIKSVERCGHVLVIGATNRPDAIDSALRRPGRFDREIVLGVPNEKARIHILSVLTRPLTLEGPFDLTKIARSTPGFVGADLDALVNKAGSCAMKRNIDRRRSELSTVIKDGGIGDEWWKQPWSLEEQECLNITMADFEEAAKMVQPSTKREGFSTIPNVKWEDVGGLDSLRQEFERYIVTRIKHPEIFEEFKVNLENGFLLFGPPGCGKTLIAKAVANEAGANFIHIKGPELLTKYVGESELAVRTIFNKARTCAPCILFFDEVDALTTKRGQEGGWVVERLLNQLLIELDGADQRRDVYVIGATNRIEVMDPAILRPGRFGKLLKVSLPGPEQRGLILGTLARGKPIDAEVDLFTIACMDACENLSGADLKAVMNEAALAAFEEKRTFDQNLQTIKLTHFESALKKVSPSVSRKEIKFHEGISNSFGVARI